MAHINAMRQIGVKNMGNRIELMEWSNKMDLIAIANEKGEVIIQRLNWQKICIFPSPGDDIKIKALSWQPDEAVIAVAYSNGRLVLLDVETEDEIYAFNFTSAIRTISWTKSSRVLNSMDIFESRTQIKHQNFLLPLPNLGSVSSSATRKTDYDTLRSFERKQPNFLVVGLTTGKACLSVFGILPCGVIDIVKYIQNKDSYEIFDVQMSSTFDEIFLCIRDGSVLKSLVLKNHILSKYNLSLLNIATKHGCILEILNYINDTIQCIIEAWETILLEMDNKLTKYVNFQSEGSLSADFLELLMFGYPSEALELFLTRDLTEKGLKKLANSIELSYTTIQQLVVKSLSSATINLLYNLNILKGMSRNTYCYEDIITNKTVENAFINAGSFLIKIIELQQAIDQSVNDYKIFCCWLCVVIVRLLEESVSDEAASVSQEDISYLAEFLNTFDDCIYEKEDGTLGKRKFNLERVGQYLEDCSLEFPSKQDTYHQWNRLLNENECLRECRFIFPHNKEFSLIQQYKALKNSINELFMQPSKTIEENFIMKCTIIYKVNSEKSDDILTSYAVDQTTKSDLFVTSINANNFIFVESNVKLQTIKAAKLNLMCEQSLLKGKFQFSDISLRDIQFYNESVLSLLLTSNTGKTSSYFIQLPLEGIRDKCSTFSNNEFLDLNELCVRFSIFDFIDLGLFKPIEGSSNSKISVSGNRKVTAILSDNNKKIRVFEMEIEEDDDEIEVCAQHASVENGEDYEQLQT